MLRTTSECMSAILGGSDTVSNTAYDAVYQKSNAFGERISRNQLLILQQEAHLQEAQRFADGAYYIEEITKQLAEKALVIFKQLEKRIWIFITAYGWNHSEKNTSKCPKRTRTIR